MRIFFFYFLLMSQAYGNDCNFEKPIKEYRPKYAKGFLIEYFKDFKVLIVKDKKYILSSTSKHEKCLHYINVKTPANRVIFKSSTYLPSLEILNLENKLVAFPSKKYIYSNKFLSDKVKDLRPDFGIEEILTLSPDLIMGSDLKDFTDKKINQYKEFKIALILNLDSEEKSPLARAEWIVFNSSFFNKEQRAIKFFKLIESNYIKIKNESLFVNDRPKVLLGDIQNGKWVYAGGESDLAQLIFDAGGELILKSRSSETQKISLEELYKMNVIADFWITHNLWTSKKMIDSSYKFLKAKKIFNYLKKVSASGSIDYWEMGMQRPDLLLRDYKNIFSNLNKPLNWYIELN